MHRACSYCEATSRPVISMRWSIGLCARRLPGGSSKPGRKPHSLCRVLHDPFFGPHPLLTDAESGLPAHSHGVNDPGHTHPPAAGAAFVMEDNTGASPVGYHSPEVKDSPLAE